MTQPLAATCPTCGRWGVPLTPSGRVKAHYTPGSRGTKCKGGKPETTNGATE